MQETEEYRKTSGDEESRGDLEDEYSRNNVESSDSIAEESDEGTSSDGVEESSTVDMKEEESPKTTELSEKDGSGASTAQRELPRTQARPRTHDYKAHDREGVELQKSEGEIAPGEGRQRRTYFRKKVCRLCVNKMKVVDYKDVDFLRKFITDRGKILPRRMTGTCAKHQRVLSRAIKRARIVALLPFVKK
jgi:small subunit ribosomal protein S18